MKRLKTLTTTLTILLFLFIRPAHAQKGENTYIVQAGDTLTHVALKYNLKIADLVAWNNIANPNLIIAGQRLVIPTEGDLPSADQLERTYTVQAGDTLFEIASQAGVRMAQLAAANGISDVDLLEVGQILVIPAAETIDNTIPLPPPFEAITFSETTIAQGRTLMVSITLSTEAELSAEFEDRPVFLSGSGTEYWGIVGIHALSEIGVYQVAFRATLPDGTEAATAQNIIVTAGQYDTETIRVVAGREGLLAPDVVQAETNKMQFIWNQVTPQRLWQGAFGYPVDDVRITSSFGTRRSYGGGPVNGFHAGTDFGGSGTPIYAPAPGKVVLAEALNVRGNAVLIDHGMGLFSGYWHQSQIVVEAGDDVARGDIIGYIGDTGLVTGPHLHWEIRLGGIAVEPLQWVQENIAPSW